MLLAFLTPLLSGILLGCCFLPPPAHWLAWIGLVPVAAAIANRQHVVAGYVGMYGAGLIFNLMTTDWLRTLEGGAGLAGRSAPDWMFQAELLALFWPVTLWIGRTILASCQLPLAVVLPATWLIHEVLLRTAWALIDQTGWRIYFLGYAVVEHDYLSQVADLGGISALGLLPACVSGAIWDLWTSWRQRRTRPTRFRAWTSAGIAVAMLVAALGYGAWRFHQTEFDLGPTVWLMPAALISEGSDGKPWPVDSSEPPDLLLWSELAYHDPPSDRAEATIGQPLGATQRSKTELALEALCRQFDVPIVIGYVRTQSADPHPARFNSVAYVDPRDGLRGSYDKIGLVPWTEFTPLQGLTSRRSQEFNRGQQYPVFSVTRGVDSQAYRFGTAICYDVAFPSLFRQFMRSADGPPDFFLVSSSERSDSTGRMSRHVLNMARVRAIECRRSIARNVQRGHSGTIDSRGQYHHASLPLQIESPTPLERIPVDTRSTLFVKWGDWIPTAVLVLLLATATLRYRARKETGGRSRWRWWRQKTAGS